MVQSGTKYLLKGGPDINCMLGQMALREGEQRCKHAVVRLAVRPHGRHLSKHPSDLLPSESSPPAGLQEGEYNSAVHWNAIHARI